MAYGKRYNIPCRANLGESTTIEIWQKDYIDSVGTLTLANDNFVIDRPFDWENYICGIACEFSILNDKANFFELLDLMMAVERKYLIKVLNLKGTVTTILFEGFINTELTQQKYLHKQVIRIVASSYLSKLEYSYPQSIEILQNMTFIDVINEILKSTGVKIPIRVNTINLPAEDTYSETTTFLNLTGLYTEVFWVDNIKRRNSLDILTSILTTFNCYLYYLNGAWYIEQFIQLWKKQRYYVEYLPNVTYSPLDSGTVFGGAFAVKDLHSLRFLDMSQILSINPGSSLIRIENELDEFLNLVGSLVNPIPNTLGTETDILNGFTIKGYPIPKIRQWTKWQREVPEFDFIGRTDGTGGYLWDLIGQEYKTIKNSIRRKLDDEYSASKKINHGLYTRFPVKIQSGTSVSIKFKYCPNEFYDYYLKSEIVDYNDDDWFITPEDTYVRIKPTNDLSDYTFTFYWYMWDMSRTKNQAITSTGLTNSLKEQGYVYRQTNRDEWADSNKAGSMILQSLTVDGSVFDLKNKIAEISILIDFDKVYGFKVDPATINGGSTADGLIQAPYISDFVFCLGTEIIKRKKNNKQYSIYTPAKTAYFGDVVISVSHSSTNADEDLPSNIIEGTTDAGFINEININLELADIPDINYRNGVLRGPELLERTDKWHQGTTFTFLDRPAYKQLVDWILRDKFLLYHVSRQQVVGTIKEKGLLKPFSLYEDSLQNDKKFILAGFRYYPLEDEYEVQLDEYEEDTLKVKINDPINDLNPPINLTSPSFLNLLQFK